MSATETVICDACSFDLSTTGNSVDYRLVLANESKTPWYQAEGLEGGAVTDMMIYPPLSTGSKHFCGLYCLQTWVDNELPSRKAGS